MTREFVALSITTYLFAALAMVPPALAYLALDATRASLRTVLGVHKLLVVTSIVLPLTLFAYATPQATGWSPMGRTARTAADLASTVDATAVRPAPPSAAAPIKTPVALATSPRGYAPTVYDLVFLFGGWLVWLPVPGFALFVSRYWRQSTRLHALVRHATSTASRDGVTVITSSDVTVPFSAGCVDKIIVVPSFINAAAAEVITRHELNHFKCNHHVWTFLEAALAHLFWFNPVVHLLRRRGGFYRELECDAKTTLSVDRLEYARLLIESAEQIGTDTPVDAVGQGWIAKSRLRKRIDYLLGQRQCRRRTVFRIGLVVSLVSTVAILASVMHVNDELLEDQILQSVNRRYAEVPRLGAPAEFERIPPAVIEALLIQEDRGFYEHHGVTLFGRSTLTQQLARNLMPRPLIRTHHLLKLRELKVTRVLESHFSKDKLIEMYLNSAFFGNQTYGIAAAARTYFNESYTDLSRDDAAMLIPFLVAPSLNNLISNPELAAENQRRLLVRMAASESQR